MTTIAEALQDNDANLRISNGDRWLVGDGNNGWIVYDRSRYARSSIVVIETQDEALAVEALLKDW